MDPKNYTNLDPKLREAYDRVMNAVISTTSTPVQPTIATPNPISPTPQTPKPPSINEAAAMPSTLPTPPPPTAGNIVAGAVPQHKSDILPAVLILGGIIFFVVYAFFWLKFFQIELPFLPNFF